MKNHTRPSMGSFVLALACAVTMGACRSDDVADPAAEPEWKIHGAVDPDSINEPAIDRQMDGADFLEANKDREGIVVLPSGLQYRVIDHGNGEKPGLEDSVLVHYKQINLDGEVVDNSRDHGSEPQSFRVAKVIGGWREALVRMREGGRWKLYVPPDLGYGSTGVLGISSNETLIYEIELFKVKKNGPPATPDLEGSLE